MIKSKFLLFKEKGKIKIIFRERKPNLQYKTIFRANRRPMFPANCRLFREDRFSKSRILAITGEYLFAFFASLTCAYYFLTTLL